MKPIRIILSFFFRWQYIKPTINTKFILCRWMLLRVEDTPELLDKTMLRITGLHSTFTKFSPCSLLLGCLWTVLVKRASWLARQTSRTGTLFFQKTSGPRPGSQHTGVAVPTVVPLVPSPDLFSNSLLLRN